MRELLGLPDDSDMREVMSARNAIPVDDDSFPARSTSMVPGSSRSVTGTGASGTGTDHTNGD